MNNILSVLMRVMVKEFYRINAGFFLIAVGILFGFLRGSDHLVLATFFTSSVPALLAPVIVWILYAAKVKTFNSLALNKNENTFLYQLAATKPSQRWALFFYISFLQLMPIVGYGVFLISVSIKANNITVPFAILGSLFILLVWMTRALVVQITQYDNEIKINLLSRKLNKRFSKPYLIMYPEWITKNQPVMVLGTKIFACLMIIGISRLYLFDSYDERLYAMGCSLIFSFNLVIVFYYQRFENFHFSLLRSLPLSLNSRLFNFCLSWTLLTFPEIACVVTNCPATINLIYLMLMIFLGISIALLGYAYLFTRDMTLESYLQIVFAASFIWIILILFKIPLIAMILVHACAGVYLYRTLFYTFEFNSEIESEK